MVKSLNRIGLSGLKMEDEQNNGLYTKLKKSFNWQVATATALFTVGLSFGIVHASSTNHHLSTQNIDGRDVSVYEQDNHLFNYKTCTVTVPSPYAGELSILYDDNCDKDLDSVLLRGVRDRLPSEALSLNKQNEAATILHRVTYHKR